MTCKTCNDTRRVKRYIGHRGRVAIFICFDCETPADRETAGRALSDQPEQQGEHGAADHDR